EPAEVGVHVMLTDGQDDIIASPRTDGSWTVTKRGTVTVTRGPDAEFNRISEPKEYVPFAKWQENRPGELIGWAESIEQAYKA
ncbi:hypothetical protein ACO1KX_13840, partial [Staphylococcus aureus]